MFTLVPGATITGTAEPNATVRVSTTVEVSGGRIDYERRVATNADGNYSVTVPYPGVYQIGDSEVRVTDAAVRNGTRTTA